MATAVARKAVSTVNQRMDFGTENLPVRIEDLADSHSLLPSGAGPVTGSKLRIGWVCAPPAGGSGGHTTLFRMVEMAEERGHECTLFLYDKNSDDVGRHEAVIRRHWKNLNARIRSATMGLDGMDAIVASSWGAAHVVATRAPATANRFYFIQDFEPYFYPRGSLYSFAEDTYRFGFHNIALGDMVASRLHSEVGVEANAIVPFGRDATAYRLLPREGANSPRTGVVYYAKCDVDRRGYLLAKLALERFHDKHPEQEIHVFGDKVFNWKIPVTNHGSLSPSDLNMLYNRTIASVALSFTNVTLVADELMAAGNVPVLNDHEFVRAVLNAPYAIWAKPSPQGIAQALSAAVTADDIEKRALLLSHSDRPEWRTTAILVSQQIERVCADPLRDSGRTVRSGR